MNEKDTNKQKNNKMINETSSLHIYCCVPEGRGLQPSTPDSEILTYDLGILIGLIVTIFTSVMCVFHTIIYLCHFTCLPTLATILLIVATTRNVMNGNNCTI